MCVSILHSTDLANRDIDVSVGKEWNARSFLPELISEATATVNNTSMMIWKPWAFGTLCWALRSKTQAKPVFDLNAFWLYNRASPQFQKLRNDSWMGNLSNLLTLPPTTMWLPRKRTGIGCAMCVVNHKCNLIKWCTTTLFRRIFIKTWCSSTCLSQTLETGKV